ncbi:MAG: ATP-binding protein [Coriobacteriales bacterium]|jgi:Fe-S-cluster-containing hydrogenase component 2
MIRRIIEIDEAKCNGCGICAEACHEGAIGMVDGKAKLLRDDYCDGLGDCLPECPTGAIAFVEREAAAYDEKAVADHLAAKKTREAMEKAGHAHHGGGCPGSRMQVMSREDTPKSAEAREVPSQLSQWPVQIKLAPVSAPFFDGCDLLIAADCTAYAYGDFHNRFIKGRVTLIGCPKLDAIDYSEKLTQILAQNDIRSITLTRMIVPCCGGLEQAVRTAIANSGKDIPLDVVIVGIDGKLQ